jgi:hypothetical protein
MTKIKFGLLAFLLLATTGGWAQNSCGPPPTPVAPIASSTSPSTIQGCLSGTEGNFVLTQDNTTIAVKLVGAGTQLKENIGREISVTGQMISPTESGRSETQLSTRTDDHKTPQEDSPADDSNSTTLGTHAFQVREVEKVSDTCGSAP